MGLIYKKVTGIVTQTDKTCFNPTSTTSEMLTYFSNRATIKSFTC